MWFASAGLRLPIVSTGALFLRLFFRADPGALFLASLVSSLRFLRLVLRLFLRVDPGALSLRLFLRVDPGALSLRLFLRVVHPGALSLRLFLRVDPGALSLRLFLRVVPGGLSCLRVVPVPGDFCLLVEPSVEIRVLQLDLGFLRGLGLDTNHCSLHRSSIVSMQQSSVRQTPKKVTTVFKILLVAFDILNGFQRLSTVSHTRPLVSCQMCYWSSAVFGPALALQGVQQSSVA